MTANLEYQIIDADERHKLVDLVNKEIQDEWVPQGGVASYFIASDDRYCRYCQAMVRTGK